VTFPTNAEVVVVGAGFAGLSAARELVRLGHDVVVLEGRDRVGGRSATTTIAGAPVDLGATFVGPTQDAVLALAAELGCETVPTYRRGKNLIRWRGRVRSYRSTTPRLSIIELLDVSRIQWRFERICRHVPVQEPWTAPTAHRLDGMTLERWLRSVHAGASTRDLMAIMARVTWGCEPDAVSMLHAVRYVKAAGGIGRMLDVEGGAQQDRFAAGTQQIAVRMADELGPRLALNAVVRRIDRDEDDSLGVECDQGRVTANRVIIAVPPEHRSGIAFDPPLPAEYEKLAGHWPQGRLSKAYAAYDTPFWRAGGCSGEALSDEGPVFITFDVSPGDAGPRHPAGVHRCTVLRPAAARRSPRARAGGFRRPVRRRGTSPDRLRRSSLGHRGIRTGWADRGGAAGLVDGVRAVAAQTGRRHPLGRDRDRR
jgi:monoamine oxidase